MKKGFAAVLASVGFTLATPASAIVVGGIDFGALGLTQEIETATFASTFVNGVGQELEGYGLVTTVNSDVTYCANNTANCSLYFHFHDYIVTYFDGTAVTFTGGVIDIYYSDAPAITFFDNDAATNIALITAEDPWVQLVGHTFADPLFNALFGPAPDTYTLNGFGALTGGSISELGAGQLDVSLGGFGLPEVQSFLNGNGAPDNLGGFADKILTTSSNNFVPNPNNNCPAGVQPPPGSFCLEGTANIRGVTNVVPEPGTLALIGLALFGLGFSRRRVT